MRSRLTWLSHTKKNHKGGDSSRDDGDIGSSMQCAGESNDQSQRQRGEDSIC
jgi:hypothetical protein